MPTFETMARRLGALLFGGVFVYAGYRKLLSPLLFQLDIRSYQLLPDPYSAVVAVVMPWLEVFSGLAVITGLLRRGGLLWLNGSLAVFIAALASAWYRGLNIKCGCFGESSEAPNYAWLIGRDVALLALGVALVWLERRRLQTNLSP